MQRHQAGKSHRLGKVNLSFSGPTHNSKKSNRGSKKNRAVSNIREKAGKGGARTVLDRRDGHTGPLVRRDRRAVPAHGLKDPVGGGGGEGMGGSF